MGGGTLLEQLVLLVSCLGSQACFGMNCNLWTTPSNHLLWKIGVGASKPDQVEKKKCAVITLQMYMWEKGRPLQHLKMIARYIFLWNYQPNPVNFKVKEEVMMTPMAILFAPQSGDPSAEKVFLISWRFQHFQKFVRFRAVGISMCCPPGLLTIKARRFEQTDLELTSMHNVNVPSRILISSRCLRCAKYTNISINVKHITHFCGWWSCLNLYKPGHNDLIPSMSMQTLEYERRQFLSCLALRVLPSIPAQPMFNGANPQACPDLILLNLCATLNSRLPVSCEAAAHRSARIDHHESSIFRFWDRNQPSVSLVSREQ